MTLEIIKNTKMLLSKISAYEIATKISDYRRLNFRSISDGDLRKAIYKVLCVENNGIESATLFQSTVTYLKGTRFYRVRPIDPSDRSIPIKSMKHEQDAWNPPTSCVKKPGRLNLVGESLLYVSANPITAIEELKIKDGECISLIVYEAKKDLKLTAIGEHLAQSFLDEEENLKQKMISDFLKDEFTRDVADGLEYLYKASEMITKDFYDLPPSSQDGWFYSSIASKPGFNVCLRPDNAKDCLDLLGVQIICVDRVPGDVILNFKFILSGFGSDGIFIPHRLDSDICKDLFPEIIIVNYN